MPDGALIEQGTPEWFDLRRGKVTASQIRDVMAKGQGKTRENYMAKLIVERLTGESDEGYKNQAMEWGTEQEPHARALFEWETSSAVRLVGFVDHPEIPMAGASPDGLLGEDGLVEFKCPIEKAVHLKRIMGSFERPYVDQAQWQMAVTGREWCQLVSYHPQMPDRLKLFMKIYERDAERIAEMEAAVVQFQSELESKIKVLEAI